VFADALRDVFRRLTGDPKPYRITFQVNGVSKPTSFPPNVGAIAFSTTPPVIGAGSSFPSLFKLYREMPTPG
jgi:hypothetical protein